MINRWTGIGRLTRDPELRYTQSGIAVTMFTIAINRPFKNGNEQEADFISVVAWRQLAELVANHLKKGNQAGVTGRLQTRTYDDKDGKRVFVTEVVADQVQFLSPNNSENKQSNNYGQPPSDPFSNDSRTVDISDDDLPF